MSQDTYLKDRNGGIIGTVKSYGDEDRLHDKNGNFIGRYNKTANMTYDGYGTIVGYGNILASLIR